MFRIETFKVVKAIETFLDLWLLSTRSFTSFRSPEYGCLSRPLDLIMIPSTEKKSNGLGREGAGVFVVQWMKGRCFQ